MLVLWLHGYFKLSWKGKMMDENDQKKQALVLFIVRKLSEQKGWHGPVFVQRFIYLLQELLDVPLDLFFILYKHGPYSFELAETLTFLTANYLLEFKLPLNHLSPTLVPGKHAAYYDKKFKAEMDAINPRVTWLITKVNDMDFGKLTLLTFALYVLKQLRVQGKDEKKLISEMHQIRPVFSKKQITEAVEALKKLMNEAQTEFTVTSW